ncbi:MAG: hypothetical protein WAN46_18275 [Gammaproteobacteria bacterium]|jgi:hypothetical protein
MKTLPLFPLIPSEFLLPSLFPDYNPGTPLIAGDVLLHTENAVYTADGRYFVIGQHKDPHWGWGLYELHKNRSGYEVSQIVSGTLNVGSSEYDGWFHGLTTDGRYLYATCAVHLEGKPTKTDYGALFRVLPTAHPVEVSVAYYQPDEVHSYNGMAVGADGAIYMTNSSAMYDRSMVAIYRVAVTESGPFDITISPWLLANPLRDTVPNGLQVTGNVMYYVAGKALFKIEMSAHGPSTPIQIYHASIPTNILDDFVVLPDGRVAIAEIDFVSSLLGLPGIGINQIVIVDTHKHILNKRSVVTSPYTVSSLAYEEGDLFSRGTLIGTSWFGGGIREFDVL